MRPCDPYESEMPSGRCGDPECLAFWNDTVEWWACDVSGCAVICCPSCYVKCFICDKTACSAHRRKFRDDDESQRWGCTSCVAEREAQPVDFRRAS